MTTLNKAVEIINKKDGRTVMRWKYSKIRIDVFNSEYWDSIDEWKEWHADNLYQVRDPGRLAENRNTRAANRARNLG